MFGGSKTRDELFSGKPTSESDPIILTNIKADQFKDFLDVMDGK